MACKLENVPSHLGLGNETRSDLHKKLKELYPDRIDPDTGDSFIYSRLREDKEFLKWFGNWMDPNEYKKLQEKAIMTGVFNHQGEPQLHKDGLGNHYVINIYGEPNYVSTKEGQPVLNQLTSKEVTSLVNSLTGKLIENQPGLDIFDYVQQELKTKLSQANKLVSSSKLALLKEKDIKKKTKLIRQRNKSIDSRDKIELVLSNRAQLNRIVGRVKARLEKFHYRYTQEAHEKEEDQGFDDVRNFILESNQTSNRAINDPDVLRILSTIPRFEQIQGTTDYDLATDPTTGHIQYMEQGAVWGLLERILVNTIPSRDEKDIYKSFIRRLDTAVEVGTHPAVEFIRDKFKAIKDESVKTKLSTALMMAKNTFLITRIGKEGKDVLHAEVINPALTTSLEGKLVQEYIQLVRNNMDIDSKGIILAGAAFDAEFTEIARIADLNEARAKAVKALSKFLNEKLEIGISEAVLTHFVNLNTRDGMGQLHELTRTFLHDKVKDFKLNQEGAFDSFNGDIAVLAKYKEMGISKKMDLLRDYLKKKSPFLKEIAASDALFKEGVSESSVHVGGSQRWEYTTMSALKYQILKWKKGELDRLEYLNRLHAGYTIIEDILGDPDKADREEINSLGNTILREIDIAINTELKKANDPNPVLHKDITELDLHFDMFIKMFNSSDKYIADIARKQGAGAEQAKEEASLRNYITYNFGADKNSLFALYGIRRPNADGTLYDSNKGALTPRFKNILSKYLRGELEQIMEAQKPVMAYMTATNPDEKQRILMEELVQGFHFNTDKDVTREELTAEDFWNGVYYKMGIFHSSLEKYLKVSGAKGRAALFDTSVDYPLVNGSFFRYLKTNDQFIRLSRIVENDVLEIADKEYEYLDTLIVKTTEDSEGNIVKQSIFDTETNIITANKEQRAYDYILGSFMMAYELSNIFNGHIGYYKHKGGKIGLTDFLKRAPAAATDGKYLRNRELEKEKTYTTYNGEVIDSSKDPRLSNADNVTVVAIVNDIRNKHGKEVKSRDFKLIQKGLKNNKLTYEHELADAQGYVTPEHFKDLVTRVYGWTATDNSNFWALNDPDHRVTDENIRWLKKFSKSFTPMKPVYFGVDQVSHSNPTPMPVYLKYSVAALFPAITKGSEAEVLLKKMQEQGVDQLIFKSGSKASNATPTNIHKLDESGEFFDGIDPDARLNPFLIDSNMLKIQTEMPTKLDSSVRLGNQAIKNIMTNMDLSDKTKQYEYNGKMYNAEEIYDMIQETAVDILQVNLNQVLQRLGYNHEQGKFDSRSIKRLLLKQMDLETEQDLKEFLNTDLPIETIPNFAQRIFPVLSAYVFKNAGKLYTRGGSVVQVANIGFDRINSKDANQVLFFEDNPRLTPPLPETDSEGNIVYYNEEGQRVSDPKEGKMRIKKAKILLPFSSIFGTTGMSYNEFKKAWKEKRIDKNLFKQAIGYRIPNQAISSNDAFEIVGILPPLAGDQAIVYHEITAKTGSDFDIDKMYLMLPNYGVKGKVVIPDDKKVKLGEDVPHLSDLIQTKKYVGKQVGVQIFNDFVSHPEIEKFMQETYNLSPNKQGKYFPDRPVGKILDNKDEIAEILAEKDHTIDKGEIFLSDLLEDLFQAWKKQTSEIDKLQGERKDEFGWYKVEKIYYKKPDTRKKFGHQQNKLIELLSSVLTAGTTYDDLMSPLDSKIVKDTINDIIYKQRDMNKYGELSKEEFFETIEPSSLQQMFPRFLTKNRTDVLEAKDLIATMANNMTDIAESQKVQFGLNLVLGLKDENGVLLSGIDKTYFLGKKGNNEEKISKAVSYLMNGAVDAAKDSYLISGNFRTYTANAAILLTRQGLDLESMFTILMNKTITDYTTEKRFQMAKISDVQPEISKRQIEGYAVNFLKLLVEKDGDLFKVISKEDFLNNTESKRELILGFWHFLETVGKEFNEAVVAAKSDANGAGTTIPEHISILNKVFRADNNATRNAFKKWFKNGLTLENTQFNPNIKDNPDVKYLGAMANNTLFLMRDLSESMFIETSPYVKRLINHMAGVLGSSYTTDHNFIKLLYNYLYPYLLKRTGNKLFNIDRDEANWLLDDFPKTLFNLRSKLREHSRDNMFLQELDISIGANSSIKWPSVKNYSKEAKLMFKEAFEELAISNETVEDMNGNIVPVVDLLVKYAYVTSGFKATHYSYNDYISPTVFIRNMAGKDVRDLLNSFSSIEMEAKDVGETLTMIARDNPKNYKIVKKAWAFKGIMSGEPISKLNIKRNNTDEEVEEAYDSITTYQDPETGKRMYLPFISSSSGLTYMLTDLYDGMPVYERISVRNTKQEIREYVFDTIDKELLVQEPRFYISESLKLLRRSGAEQFMTNLKAYEDLFKDDTNETNKDC